MQNGTYLTDAGSEVTLSGKHSGISRVKFDWAEEHACCDCVADPFPEEDDGELYLIWDCNVCGGGRAKLSPVK